MKNHYHDFAKITREYKQPHSGLSPSGTSVINKQSEKNISMAMPCQPCNRLKKGI